LHESVRSESARDFLEKYCDCESHIGAWDCDLAYRSGATVDASGTRMWTGYPKLRLTRTLVQLFET